MTGERVRGERVGIGQCAHYLQLTCKEIARKSVVCIFRDELSKTFGKSRM